MSFGPSRDLAAGRLKYGGPRIYDRSERWALRGFDLFLRLAAPLTGLTPPRATILEPTSLRQILALRLDRLGDLLMTLPALKELRQLAPDAEIELAVGSWNEEIARGLPFVDRVRIVDAPWAAWGKKASWRRAARAMRPIQDGAIPELAIDFQGDVRVNVLMALTGAPFRAGYVDTGGRHLLTHLGLWDEAKSWYRQNVELLEVLFPRATTAKSIEPYNFLLPEDRSQAAELLRRHGLDAVGRPLIGVHPSAGRAIKQWEVHKFSTLVDGLVESTSGRVILTGAPSDRDLVEQVAAKCRTIPHLLIGEVGLRGFAAVIERLDLFITGDTGPMHLADAVGSRGVAIFGPSDPRRYRPEISDHRTGGAQRSLLLPLQHDSKTTQRALSSRGTRLHCWDQRGSSDGGGACSAGSGARAGRVLNKSLSSVSPGCGLALAFWTSRARPRQMGHHSAKPSAPGRRVSRAATDNGGGSPHRDPRGEH